MNVIDLNGNDAAEIVLALIADQLHGKTVINVKELQAYWRVLGLRMDDLIQGLTALSRNNGLKIEGEGEEGTLHLADAMIKDLPSQGEGLSSLDPRLSEILEIAARRKGAADESKPGHERRQGFK